MIDIKNMSPALRESAFFAAWIASILLIASLAWFLTAQARNDFLITAVNRTNFYSRERVYIERHIPAREMRGNAARLGSWFTVRETGERALVFTLFAQGNFLPCMALVNSQGKVEEILPLSVHAETMLKRTPEGVINLYMRRIEGALK